MILTFSERDSNRQQTNIKHLNEWFKVIHFPEAPTNKTNKLQTYRKINYNRETKDIGNDASKIVNNRSSIEACPCPSHLPNGQCIPQYSAHTRIC